MKNYTYKDGLKVLNYIGINSLTDYEIFLIHKKWIITCRFFDNDLINILESLYVGTLPPHSYPKNYKEIMNEREKEFSEKVKKLKGKNLEKILKL